MHVKNRRINNRLDCCIAFIAAYIVLRSLHTCTVTCVGILRSNQVMLGNACSTYAVWALLLKGAHTTTSPVQATTIKSSRAMSVQASLARLRDCRGHSLPATCTSRTCSGFKILWVAHCSAGWLKATDIQPPGAHESRVVSEYRLLLLLWQAVRGLNETFSSSATISANTYVNS